MSDNPNAPNTSEELITLQERFQAFSSASFEAIFLSEKGICIDQNDTAKQMFGWTREEAIGRPGTDWIVPDDREHVMKSMLEGVEHPYDVTALRKNGTIFPCEIQARMMEYQGRQVRVTALRDVTKLRLIERRNKALINAIPDQMFVMDQHGILQDYSGPTGAPLYRNPDEFLGRPVSNIMPEHIAVQAQQVAAQTYFDDSVQSFEYELKINKKLYTYEARACQYSDHHVVFIVRDVTELRRMEASESRATRLETAGRIAGQIAHDLNNLLAPLTGYPELIREELDPNHPVVELIDEMEVSARQIADINQKLLCLGRRGHYNMEPVDVNQVIETVMIEFHDLPDSVLLEKQLATDLLPVMGGSAQLSRVVANLLHNAVDAVDQRGCVSISTENFYLSDNTTEYAHIDRGEYVLISIRDDGIGIPPENRDKVFDPFFTTKSTDQQRGSGLGLSVVNGVVEDHNGFVNLESATGLGSVFTVYLPITRQEIPAPVDAKFKGHGETILVIDDDPIQRTVAVRLLQHAGYQASAVESGERALEILRKKPHDLLVLDMVMPGGIDGGTTYSRALEINPNQKGIIVSGYADTKAVHKAQQLGVTEYLKKPMSLESLCQPVQQSLPSPTN